MSGSLYVRLGGQAAISAVVDELVARCVADERINAKFARSDIGRLKVGLVDQVCQAAGGPFTYLGNDMWTAHRGMAVTAGEFDALVGNLVSTLDHLGVGFTEKSELLGILGPLRSRIVEVESSATGTPLPEFFQAAPPLAGTVG